jgi:hypothetical protein
MASVVVKCEEDKLNNNVNNESGSSMDSHPHLDPKDEYLEDPLPDLVGSLRTTEEPEPDFLETTEYALEDFEFSIETSDEEEDEEEDEESSGSDLEFYDANASTVTSTHCPETENESVELELGTEGGHGIGSGGEGEGSGNSKSTQTKTRLGTVRATASRMATSVKEMVGKRKKSKKNIRVLYHNLDKPYTARVSATQTFKRFLTLGQGQGWNFYCIYNCKTMGHVTRALAIVYLVLIDVYAIYSISRQA